MSKIGKSDNTQPSFSTPSSHGSTSKKVTKGPVNNNKITDRKVEIFAKNICPVSPTPLHSASQRPLTPPLTGAASVYSEELPLGEKIKALETLMWAASGREDYIEAHNYKLQMQKLQKTSPTYSTFPAAPNVNKLRQLMQAATNRGDYIQANNYKLQMQKLQFFPNCSTTEERDVLFMKRTALRTRLEGSLGKQIPNKETREAFISNLNTQNKIRYGGYLNEIGVLLNADRNLDSSDIQTINEHLTSVKNDNIGNLLQERSPEKQAFDAMKAFFSHPNAEQRYNGQRLIDSAKNRQLTRVEMQNLQRDLRVLNIDSKNLNLIGPVES